MNRKRGRPVKETEKRDKKLQVRFTKTEKEKITKEAEKLGINISQYIRSKALNGTQQVVHVAALIANLDRVGGELTRVGGNINQLAKQANVLNKTGKLDQTVVVKFNVLFAEYIKIQQETEVALRKIITETRG